MSIAFSHVNFNIQSRWIQCYSIRNDKLRALKGLQPLERHALLLLRIELRPSGLVKKRCVQRNSASTQLPPWEVYDRRLRFNR